MHLGFVFNKPASGWSDADVTALGLELADRLEQPLTSKDRSNLPKQACFDSQARIYINDKAQYEVMCHIVDEYHAVDSEIGKWVNQRGVDLGFVKSTGNTNISCDRQLFDFITELTDKMMDEVNKHKFVTDDHDKERHNLITDFIVQGVIRNNPEQDEVHVIKIVDDIMSTVLTECSDETANTSVIYAHAINTIMNEI